VQSPANWPQEIGQFAGTYRAAVGSPLAFIRADVQWSKRWQAQLRTVATDARGTGIQFGVIVDSDRPGSSNVDWTQHAEERLTDVHAILGHFPDQLVFQSWQAHPTHFLPETEPGTLTSLVKKAAP